MSSCGHVFLFIWGIFLEIKLQGCILTNTWYCLSFLIVSCCGFNLCFPDDQWLWASFYVPFIHLHIFFSKTSVKIFSLFLWNFCLLKELSIVYNFGYNLFIHKTHNLQVFSSNLSYLVFDICWSMKILNFDEIQLISFFLLWIIVWCLKNSLFIPRSKRFSPRISPRNSIIFSLSFRFIIHFVLIFMHSVRLGSNSIIAYVDISFLQYWFLKRLPFLFESVLAPLLSTKWP